MKGKIKAMTCLITMRSETYSHKGVRALRENGIPSSITKLDPELSKKGCSYGIKFDCRHRAVVQRVLSDNKIPYSDIRSL